MEGRLGSTTFEISYGRLNSFFATQLQSLVRPGGCTTSDPRRTIRAFELQHRDAFFNREVGEITFCEPLINQPYSYRLTSCSALPEDDERLSECVYENDEIDECTSDQVPNRTGARNHFLCTKTPRTGAGTCGVCRPWYELTGQAANGWTNEVTLVDQCQVAREQDGTCGASCRDACRFDMQTFHVSECGPYIGPTDTKTFGNPRDYRCGEVPVGRTNPDIQPDVIAGDGWKGDPDEVWKTLTTWQMPTPKPSRTNGFLGREIPVVAKIGRLEKQRASSFTIRDLGAHADRQIASPATMDLSQLWWQLRPADFTVRLDGDNRTVEGLAMHLCAFIPGNEIDLGEIVFNQNEDWLWAILRKVDAGTLTFERLRACMDFRAWLDPDANDPSAEDINVEFVKVSDIAIRNAQHSGLDFAWGGANFLPFFMASCRRQPSRPRASRSSTMSS